MMFRTLSVIAVLIVGSLGFPGRLAAQDDGLQLGKPYPAETGEPMKMVTGPKGAAWTTYKSYAHEAPVELKKGQSITINVTLDKAVDRLIVVILDKTGQTIDGTTKFETKTAKFVAKDMSPAGTYKIVVLTNRPVGFTLTASDLAAKKGGVAELEAKVRRLENELEEARKQLAKAKEEEVKQPKKQP